MQQRIATSCLATLSEFLTITPTAEQNLSFLSALFLLTVIHTWTQNNIFICYLSSVFQRLFSSSLLCLLVRLALTIDCNLFSDLLFLNLLISLWFPKFVSVFAIFKQRVIFIPWNKRHLFIIYYLTECARLVCAFSIHFLSVSAYVAMCASMFFCIHC